MMGNCPKPTKFGMQI